MGYFMAHHSHGRGRSGFAKRNIRPGDLCVSMKELHGERRKLTGWRLLMRNYYCLDVVYNQEVYTIDVTSKHNAPERYINRARRNPN